MTSGIEPPVKPTTTKQHHDAALPPCERMLSVNLSPRSLLDEDLPLGELQAALADHRELVAGRSSERSKAHVPDRAAELRARERSARVRVYRRLGRLQALAGSLEDDLRNHAVRR